MKSRFRGLNTFPLWDITKTNSQSVQLRGWWRTVPGATHTKCSAYCSFQQRNTALQFSLCKSPGRRMRKEHLDGSRGWLAVWHRKNSRSHLLGRVWQWRPVRGWCAGTAGMDEAGEIAGLDCACVTVGNSDSRELKWVWPCGLRSSATCFFLWGRLA